MKRSRSKDTTSATLMTFWAKSSKTKKSTNKSSDSDQIQCKLNCAIDNI